MGRLPKRAKTPGLVAKARKFTCPASGHPAGEAYHATHHATHHTENERKQTIQRLRSVVRVVPSPGATMGDAVQVGDARPRSNVAAAAGGRVQRRGLTGGHGHQENGKYGPARQMGGAQSEGPFLARSSEFRLHHGQKCCETRDSVVLCQILYSRGWCHRAEGIAVMEGGRRRARPQPPPGCGNTVSRGWTGTKCLGKKRGVG